MFRNYLLTAWRHMAGNRLFSVINVFGLAVGLMSCILIMLFVKDELGYDTWLPDAERIVRLHTAYYSPDRPPFLTVNSAGRMKEAISGYAPALIEDSVRLVRDRITVIKGEDVFAEDVVYAEAGFFSVFDLPFVHGSKETSFTKPMDVIINEQLAMKFFGRTDVIGERLTFCCLGQDRSEVTITGVIRDLPHNTHLDIKLLGFFEPSMFADFPNVLETWTSVNTLTYFKLAQGAEVSVLKERVDYWLNNESPLKDMVDEGEIPSDRLHLKFMPITDIHLHAIKHAGSMGDFKPLGDISMVYAMSGIAGLVLLIASINFMNLSTARASRRAREVALRKVMGASRHQVALQFIGEAVTITVVALVVALAAVEVVLPYYNEAIDKQLSMVIYDEPLLIVVLLVLTALVGLFAGSYPAFYLSRFLPARTLKSNQSSDGGQGRIRAALVVFQFAISIGLAVCTVVIYGQTLFAKNLDVGYSYAEKLAVLGLNQAGARDQKDTIVDKLSRIEGVSSVVLSSEVPSQDRENNTGFRLISAPAGSEVEPQVLNYHTVGFDFFESYDMNVVAGRSFNEAYGADVITVLPEGSEQTGQAAVVLNASAARQLGFADPAQAIGHTLRANVFRAGRYELEIIGIVEDVYFRSIKFGIRPSVYFNFPDALQAASISYVTDDLDKLQADVEQVWKELVPATPLDARFVGDMVMAQYKSEQAQAQLFAAFSILAVVIACLGLYGLASFMAERRTREIGIRKVMGARVSDIVRLLVWQFSLPVLVANIVAWPLAFYLMNNWLQGFSYRVDSGFILLAALGAGTGALLIAWLTVAGRALKVASENPINALRYE